MSARWTIPTPWLAILLVIALLAASLGPVVPALAQTGSDWRCMTINGSVSLNIRGGPGVGFPVLAALAPGVRVEADYTRLSMGTDYNWVPVRFADNGRLGEGWSITPRLTPCPAGVEADLGPIAPPPPTVDPSITLESLFANAELSGINQDGLLDRDEIAQVAASVVLVANVQRGRITGTGTGTIITPQGLVLTNAHVVEDAEYAAIGLLNDINDPPEFRYFADIIGYDADTDAALLAIRSDTSGRQVNTAALGLPAIPATLPPGDVFRGDMIYIFGYPSIGDDYLVVTTGSIVSVENGDMNGQRLPVWYRTDAELAPGNSGGLAVNSNGEFVGVPTFVRSEGETGGRLGGIRPAQVALMAVLSTAPAAALSTVTSAAADTGPVPFTAYAAELGRIAVTHGVNQGGQPGLDIRLSLTLTGWENRRPILYAQVFLDTLNREPLRNPNAALRFRGPGDQVRAAEPLAVSGPTTVFDDLALFIPYEALGATAPEPLALAIEIGVVSADGAWVRALSWEFVTLEP